MSRRHAGLWLAVAGLLSVVLPGALVSSAAAAAPPGTPWTWGASSFGELGKGSTSPSGPGPVSGLTGVVDMHGGREHVAALTSDGQVYVWGSNVEGQLGLGGTANRSTPTPVPGFDDVAAVETGHNYTIVLREDGTVWAWGLNASGQLGDGTTTLRRTPVRVSGLTGIVAVAAGRDMSYAVTSGGTVMAWGRNDEGQLGDGTRTDRLTPVPVSTLTNVVEIAGGRDHALARRSNGTVWAWGWNRYGQVGDGTTADRLTPVQVATGMTGVIAGAHHSYALRADGQVMSWGRNYRSQLGDGTGTQRLTPVQVIGVDDAVSLASGRDHGVAVMADGGVMTWGYNDGGQLGDGTLVERSRAITVPGVSGATFAAGGGSQYSVVLVGSGSPPPPPPPNQPPTAAFTFDCTDLACDFDGRGSSDSDGTVQAHSWNFGDGTPAGSGATTSHTFAAAGGYDVVLTVTDDDGATDTQLHRVTVTEAGPPPPPPPGGDVTFVAADSSNTNSTSFSVQVPGVTQAGDLLLLFVSEGNTTPLAGPGPGWTQRGRVTDSSHATTVWSRVATAADSGDQVTLTATDGRWTKTALTLATYRGADPTSPLAGIAGAPEPGDSASHTTPTTTSTAPVHRVSYWSDKSSATTGWTAPGGESTRATTTGSGGGRIGSLLTDHPDLQPAGSHGGLTATANAAANKATMWTVLLRPGGDPGPPPPNQPPTAAFTFDCTDLACDFDGRGSSDSDGSVDSHSWDFGDGTPAGSGATTSHTFAAAGGYDVVLTVTDDDGATDTQLHRVTVTEAGPPPPPPPGGGIGFVAVQTVDRNTIAPSITVPGTVSAGDQLVLFMTTNRDATATTPGGWTLRETVTDSGDLRSWVFTRTATAGDAGSSVNVTFGTYSKTNLTLLAYEGAGPPTAVAALTESGSGTQHATAPAPVATAGSTVVSYWVDETSAAHGWTLPAEVTQRSATAGSGGGRLTTVSGDTADVAAGTWPGATATAGVSASKAVGWTVVLPPA